MKKVFINFKTNEEDRKRFAAISDQYEFVYEPEKDANIIVGNYSPKKLQEFENLEWFQASAIGVDNYIKKGVLKEGTILTNAVDVHSREVAEHIMGVMITLLKNLHLYRDNQKECLWHDEGPVKSYRELKATIVGFGDIGNCLAKMLKGLGVYVIGVKRTMIDKPEYLDELYTNKDLLKAVSNVDVVISVLPGTKETTNMFTLDVFKAMDKETIFINAGRGNLYTEETLCEVLDNNIIKAIGVDVFEKEPLDPNSRLWQYKNILITPHVAGFFHLESARQEFVELVAENLKRFINNEELKYVVTERE